MLINKEIAFNAVHTFECGQCFRWNCDENGIYTGISDGRVCHLKELELICNKDDEEFWYQYFDLGTDYAKIHSKLIKADENLKKCIEYGSGIRILRQNVWETIISFIISANNNIPRIKKIIETLCRMYGEKITDGENIYYSFPTPERLASLKCEDLAPLRAGYRDKYILDAACKVSGGEVDLGLLNQMEDMDVKKTLMKIKGVGGKVADCIMLFSLGRASVFPTDVWIKRILNDVYKVDEKNITQFVNERYGSLAGFAQQYLYYYYRDNN